MVTDGTKTLPTMFRDLMTVTLKASVCNTLGEKVSLISFTEIGGTHKEVKPLSNVLLSDPYFPQNLLGTSMTSALIDVTDDTYRLNQIRKGLSHNTNYALR